MPKPYPLIGERTEAESLMRCGGRREPPGRPTGRGVVPCDVDGEHGGLLDERGIELLVAEAGLRGKER